MGRTPLVVRRLTDDVSALEVGDGDVENSLQMPREHRLGEDSDCQNARALMSGQRGASQKP